jgi:hypothetical protein
MRQMMGRYYFHVQCDDGLIEDPEGSEFADESAAFEEAAQSARAILVDALKSRREPSGCSVLIADEQGHQVGVVRLADVLPERIKSDLAHA